MKLTTLTEHSDYLETLPISDAEKWQLHCKRKNFGKQPLTLGMFVPTDANGNVLQEPDVRCVRDGSCQCGEEQVSDCREWKFEYNKAKERVLFEGFEVVDIYHTDKKSFEVTNDKFVQICIYKHRPNYFIWNFKTVEDLAEKELTLTPTAIKQIKL